MTRFRVKLPAVGEVVEDVTILEWHVEVGAILQEGADLLSVEAEKVDLVIPSPVEGTLVEILAEEGVQVSVGDQLCVVESG